MLEPVGYVHSGRRDLSDDHWGGVTARIELAEGFPTQCLDGLESFRTPK